ncbi:type II toxin-antitoxin system HicA family toxin [Leptospirillum ferriphilum]|uniref:type II toxin-antitoxin system HicA family toxin n=1 Tax=Leptospirillum ferriphilum TaxID=178606 RepID=UPI003EE72418
MGLWKDGRGLERIEGSHHIFKKTGSPSLIPGPGHKAKDVRTGAALAICHTVLETKN